MDDRLIASLGRGGMADVLLAVRSGASGYHKLVVIKRLRSDLVREPEAPRYRELLLDEGRLAVRLRHPNIVETYEVAEIAGEPRVVMQYLEGQSLGRVASRARREGAWLPIAYALRIVADILDALDHAHALADFDGSPLGIVHRDVGPQNVFWTYDGEIKLLDFGVAKSARSTTETEAGVVKGKVAYMAPEQARGAPIDRRADIFAVGILLWELASGRRLFRAESSAIALQRLLFEPIPPLAAIAPDVDPAIAAICDRALAREPADRYPTARAMRDDLDRVLGNTAPRRDDLAAFIRTRFVDERAAMTRLVQDALAVPGGPIADVARDHESKEVEISTRETAIERTTPLSSPSETRLPPKRRRRWQAIVAAGALAALAGIGVAWFARDGAPAALLAAPPAAATIVAPIVAPVPKPTIQLCGSNTVGAELAPALVAAFLASKGATAIHRTTEPEHARVTATLASADVVIDIAARGTATAFEGLVAGTCDVGMASRAINDKELAASPSATENVIGLDGIAVITHPNNPIAALDRGQLHDIFTGKITDWSAVGGAPGPIALYARDVKSGTFDTFKSLVLAKDPLPDATHRFADSRELADAVAGDPSAIGFIGLAYIRSAKALAVSEPGGAPMLPTSFTVTTEEYMLSRRLYLYTTSAPRSPLAAELVSFVLSPEGQTVVRGTSFIDLAISLRDPPPCDARCFPAYVATTAHAQRLSLDFRFRSGSDLADSRATRDLDRVVQFLRTQPGARLVLLGFSDNAGDPMANARLSRHRATTIAKELATRGVQVATVAGFGAAMPIASNATEADRQRNRRVEVWLAR